MRRRGATEAGIETALHEHNTRRCHPPLSEQEVQKIAASVMRYAPGGPDPLERAWQATERKSTRLPMSGSWGLCGDCNQTAQNKRLRCLYNVSDSCSGVIGRSLAVTVSEPQKKGYLYLLRITSHTGGLQRSLSHCRKSH